MKAAVRVPITAVNQEEQLERNLIYSGVMDFYLKPGDAERAARCKFQQEHSDKWTIAAITEIVTPLA